MSILGLTEAKYLCRAPSSALSASPSSFRNWARTLSVGKQFAEGTPEYEVLQGHISHEVMRLVVLSASQYRRSFDLMLPASAAWAQVTLYYGAFFAAQALLAMFGAAKLGDKTVLEVVNGSPGSQVFKVSRVVTLSGGSHQLFWSHFYLQAAMLIPLVDTAMRRGLQPVSGDDHWLIKERNRVNYDAYVAIDLAGQCKNGLRYQQLRQTLPGNLGTQLEVLESLLLAVKKYAKELRISPEAVAAALPPAAGRRAIRNLVLSDAPSSIARHARKRCVV